MNSTKLRMKNRRKYKNVGGLDVKYTFSLLHRCYRCCSNTQQSEKGWVLLLCPSGSECPKISRMMRQIAVTVATLLLVALEIPTGLTLPSTVPAFLWSPLEDGNGIKEAVNYQTLSTKDLAKSVLSEGGWSNLLCSGKEAQHHSVDVALLFVRRELQSWDSSGAKHVDSSVVDFLEVSFTGANFTLAFPYIAASQEEEAVESSLISEFAETCGHNLAGKVSFMESCSLDGGNYEKLSDIKTFHDYLVSRMEKRQKGQAYLAVFCQGSSHSESLNGHAGQILSELISSMEQSGAMYTVLYVSDPLRPVQYPSYRELERFLAESASGNGSFNSTSCDGVCLVKSSLLEGILVGIVLLLILISGLCCVVGIDTPARFETPQDS
ncbi:uncharacterized protein LOC131314154 [Rhododendron vialii]|uniref:uncharacterized protein LOC131314154 n=1 Tax=Rhododendron vialii TaxID=182163 RepID=UPI00265F4A03|nr:uncharacterized protein LOC131314154 [Rhododendron vialii]